MRGHEGKPRGPDVGCRADRLGRLHVDQFMRLTGATNIFAAGDVASCVVDGKHSTVMSCHIARPMGRFAGNNVVADLLGQPMLPLDIDWYVTVLDLGAWGALHTLDGTASCTHRSPRQGDQASDQPAANLSTQERFARGHSRCRRTDSAEDRRLRVDN